MNFLSTQSLTALKTPADHCGDAQAIWHVPERKTKTGMSKLTTLCYIRKNNSYLMLYRNRKENDENAGKWIGVGGKVKDGESPDDCLLREVFEETGLKLTSYRYKGLITFVSDVYETEYMFLYEGLSWTGEISKDCDEGSLAWIPFDEISALPLWEGDRLFLPELIRGKEDIRMRLVYKGDTLSSYRIYGDML